MVNLLRLTVVRMMGIHRIHQYHVRSWSLLWVMSLHGPLHLHRYHTPIHLHLHAPHGHLQKTVVPANDDSLALVSSVLLA